MKSHTLVLLYSLFAAIATLANLLAQRFVLSFDETKVSFVAAMLVGTAVGLVIKYLLDKRWIFYDESTGVKSHSKKFALYTVMGIITTLIFWGMETGFFAIWKTDRMREVGAVLGLAVGYVVKYQLDKRYVFNSTQVMR